MATSSIRYFCNKSGHFLDYTASLERIESPFVKTHHVRAVIAGVRTPDACRIGKLPFTGKHARTRRTFAILKSRHRQIVKQSNATLWRVPAASQTAWRRSPEYHGGLFPPAQIFGRFQERQFSLPAHKSRRQNSPAASAPGKRLGLPPRQKITGNPWGLLF